MVTQKCLVLLDHESGMLFIVSWCFGGLFGINTVAKLTVLVVLKEGWSLFYRAFQRHVYYNTLFLMRKYFWEILYVKYLIKATQLFSNTI